MAATIVTPNDYVGAIMTLCQVRLPTSTQQCILLHGQASQPAALLPLLPMHHLQYSTPVWAWDRPPLLGTASLPVSRSFNPGPARRHAGALGAGRGPHAAQVSDAICVWLRFGGLRANSAASPHPVRTAGSCFCWHTAAKTTWPSACLHENGSSTPLHPPRPPTRYHLPLAELGGDFYDELKSLSSGYASFDYEEAEYR